MVFYHFFLKNMLEYYENFHYSQWFTIAWIFLGRDILDFLRYNLNNNLQFLISFCLFIEVYSTSPFFSISSTSTHAHIWKTLDYVEMIYIGSFNAKFFWINIAFEMNKVEQKKIPQSQEKGNWQNTQAYLWKSEKNFKVRRTFDRILWYLTHREENSM